MNESSSLLIRRRIGRSLRQQRERAERTMKSVQDDGIFSESKIARIEAGKVPVLTRDLWIFGRLYHIDEDLLESLIALSQGSMQDRRWEEFADAVPARSRLYLEMEECCSGLSTYETLLVPVALQTGNYARAVIESDGSASEDARLARLNVQEERRRHLLERSNRSVRVCLSMGVLARVIGSRAVMDDQVAHLVELDSTDGVDVRVLPWSAQAPSGIDRPFTILEFDDPDDPSVVYLEHMTGAQYLEKPNELQTYRHRFQEVFDQSVPISSMSAIESTGGFGHE